jgi:hypothetical protein
MYFGAVMDLQLPMQSVPITTNAVSSNPFQANCTRYNIMWLSLSVTCGRFNFICWLQLEESEVEMCDEIYEVYTDLLQQSEEEDDTLCYKTYHLVRVRVIVFNATFLNLYDTRINMYIQNNANKR